MLSVRTAIVVPLRRWVLSQPFRIDELQDILFVVSHSINCSKRSMMSQRELSENKKPAESSPRALLLPSEIS